MTSARAGALLALGCAACLCPRTLHAEATVTAPPPADVLDRPLVSDTPRPERVIGIAELNLGWLVLPVAEVCGAEGCARGDTTPLVEIWNLVRFHPHFAAGGGVTVGPFSTTGVSVATDGGIDRRHSRGYFTLEALGRYYFLPDGSFDPWLGVGTGLVVMSDTFASAEDVSGDSLVGNPGVTLTSEGFSAFLAGGFGFFSSQHLHLGATGKLGLWQLPSPAAQSPFLDQASLVGTQFYVSLGLSAAFHADL